MRSAGRHPLLGNLALILASVVASWLALEAGLRLFWGGFYVKLQEPYTELDPVRGWRNRRDVSVTFAAPEFSTVVSNNAWGYRGAPLELERSEGQPE